MPLPPAKVLYAAIAAIAVVALGLLFAPGQGPTQGSSGTISFYHSERWCEIDVALHFRDMDSQASSWTFYSNPDECSLIRDAANAVMVGRESIGSQVQKAKQ